MSNLSAPPAHPAAPTANQRSTASTTSEENINVSTTIDVTNSSQINSKHNENPNGNNNSTTTSSTKSLVRTNPKHASSSTSPIPIVNTIPPPKHSSNLSTNNNNNNVSPPIGVMTSLPHTFFSSPQPPMFPPHPHTPSPITHPLAHPPSPYHPHPAQSYQPPPPPFPPYNPAVAAAAASPHFFPPGHHHHHHHMYAMAQPPWHTSSDPFAPPPPPPPPHTPFFPWSPAPVPPGPHTNPNSHRLHDTSVNHKHSESAHYLQNHVQSSLPMALQHQAIQQSRSLMPHHSSSVPFYERGDERENAAITAAANAAARGPPVSTSNQKGRGRNRRGNAISHMHHTMTSNANVGNTISDHNGAGHHVQGGNNSLHPNSHNSGHTNTHRSHGHKSGNTSSGNSSSAHAGHNNNNNNSANNAANETDTETAAADLNKAARKAVEAGDEVTLALLLTSWANSLEEAQQHPNGSGRQFETIFLCSQALEIVTSDILLKDSSSDSPVRQALLSLQRLILYGPDSLHVEVADRAVALNEDLEKKTDAPEKARCLQERQSAFSTVSSFLKELSANLQAYKDILPDAKESKQPAEPRSPVANGVEPSSGPAGPDPTKIVERSMDEWRRAVARLQGEMALIVILQQAFDEVSTLLNPPTGSVFIELDTFYVTVQQKIKDCITEDLEKRTEKLRSENWQQVTAGADKTVFKAAQDRAEMWISQFESSKREIESQLDDAGIGFGPSARVSDNKFPVLVSASARVAALVSCHQHAFTWAKETTSLLHCMVAAFESLEKVGDGSLAASPGLRKKFFQGLNGAFRAIDTVVNWSFSPLHDKVMGSLEKSTNGMNDEGTTQPPKVRQLRFTVPVETSSKDDGSNDGGMTPSQGRRKPRHARMKSSPDALLHLNANFSEFPDVDGEGDASGSFDREGDYIEEKDSETTNSHGEESTTTTQTVSSPPPTETTTLTTSEVTEVSPKPIEKEELPVVYEGKLLENAEEDEGEEDEDDKDIIIHEDLEDSSKPKKVNHSSHIRSMSVDGIPF